MNSSLSPTSPAASLSQPTHSLTISLIGFPQMTVLVSEHTATNSLPQLQHWESPASSGPVSQSAVTLPIEFCQLLAMQFLPTAYHLAPLLANIIHGHQTIVLPYCFPPEKPTITVTPGPLPPPSLLCPPPLGLWHLPQTEHPRGPLGNPSARSIEVFLIVS